MDFDNFVHVLLAQRALPKLDGSAADGRAARFYDLGSGTGRAVFAAALAIDVDAAVGIEYVPGLYRAAEAIRSRFEREVAPRLGYGLSRPPPRVTFELGDLATAEWLDGDVVFANSTCFSDALLATIAARCAGLKVGARVITFTSALPTRWLKVIYKKRFDMSWGPATVYVHEKVDAAAHAARRAAKEPDEFDDDQGLLELGGEGARPR